MNKDTSKPPSTKDQQQQKKNTKTKKEGKQKPDQAHTVKQENLTGTGLSVREVKIKQLCNDFRFCDSTS